MSLEAGKQPQWQRLGEVELAGWENAPTDETLRSTLRATIRSALTQTAAHALAIDEMQIPIESAIFEALARKSPAKAIDCQQQLVITCLGETDATSAQARNAAGWSFFVIERPAVQKVNGTVEVIELCLYHE